MPTDLEKNSFLSPPKQRKRQYKATINYRHIRAKNISDIIKITTTFTAPELNSKVLDRIIVELCKKKKLNLRKISYDLYVERN